MKKLALVLVCFLIIVVFVGFNYLLWERESREKDIEALRYSNENNDATINALGREIKSLEDENKKQEEKISELTESVSLLEASNASLLNDKNNLSSELSDRDSQILILKKFIDQKITRAPIEKWAELLTDKEYEAAYNLVYMHILNIGEPPGIEEFTASFSNIVKSVSIESIQPVSEGIPAGFDEQLVYEVLFKVILEKGAQAESTIYPEGENKRYFFIAYDANLSSWVIAGIEEKL
jgi:hypothetical protein